jgi:hypothetical protein
MAVRHAWHLGQIGSFDLVKVVLPGINYRTRFPKLVSVKVEWDYGIFAGQGSTPMIGGQFQTNPLTQSVPGDKDFLMRAIKFPSVMAWDGVHFSGAFDLSVPAFASILSRAPVAAKQLYFQELGTFSTPTDFWLDITYEVKELDDVEKVQFLLSQF